MGYSPAFTCFLIVDSTRMNILALTCLQNLHLAILQTDFIIRSNGNYKFCRQVKAKIFMSVESTIEKHVNAGE